MSEQAYTNSYEINPYNDAELVFSDGSIKVSRQTLAERVKYFSDLFIKDTTKTKFNILNMKLADFKVYYEYVWLGKNFKINPDKIVSLLTIQIELNLPELKIKLKEWIQQKEFIIHQGIFFENSCNNELKELNELSKKLITTDFKDLCEIKAFDSFTRDNFMCLMTKDFVKDKDQSVILNIISTWVDYDFNNRKPDWLNLVTQIDYSKLGQNELDAFIKKNRNVFILPKLIEFLYMKLSEKINHTQAIAANLHGNLQLQTQMEEAMRKELWARARLDVNNKLDMENRKFQEECAKRRKAEEEMCLATNIINNFNNRVSNSRYTIIPTKDEISKIKESKEKLKNYYSTVKAWDVEIRKQSETVKALTEQLSTY